VGQRDEGLVPADGDDRRRIEPRSLATVARVLRMNKPERRDAAAIRATQCATDLALCDALVCPAAWRE
jgi:hypothetical protein